MTCDNKACARHAEADGVTIHVRNPYYAKRDNWGFLTGVDRDGNDHQQAHGFLAQADGKLIYALPALVPERVDKAVRTIIYGEQQ